MLGRAERQATAVVGMLIFGVLLVLVYLFLNDAYRVGAEERIRESNILRGQEIFASNCATCHGNAGQGGVGLKLDIPANHPKGESAETARRTYLTRTLVNGRPGTYMQPWSNTNGGPLNSEQISALVTMMMYGNWEETAAHVDEHYAKANPPSTLAPPTGPLSIYTGGVGGNPALGTRPMPSGVQNPTPAAGMAAAAPAGDAMMAAGNTMVSPDNKLTAVLKDFAIEQDFGVVKAGMVTINIRNVGPSPHNYQIKGNGVDKLSKTINMGQTEVMMVDLKPGTYTVICQIAGHEQLGMKTTLVVQ